MKQLFWDYWSWQVALTNCQRMNIQELRRLQIWYRMSKHYLEKARWGDADTYVKLADCYRNGVDVKADFMGMTAMLAMAEQY